MFIHVVIIFSLPETIHFFYLVTAKQFTHFTFETPRIFNNKKIPYKQGDLTTGIFPGNMLVALTGFEPVTCRV